MASEVCTSLGLAGKVLSGKLLHVEEQHGSDASFVLGSVMWHASQADTTVCLLALHHSATHYQHVAKRLGYNLKAAVENKTAIVLEPFSMYVEKTGSFSDIDMGNEDNLKRLFFDVKNALESISGRKCLIVDDLGGLLSLGSSVRLVFSFLQYLRSLQKTDKDLALVLGCHCSEDSEEQSLLSNFITYVSNYSMTISGLKTGFSANVTGSIEVVDNLDVAYVTDIESKVFHYKLTDRTVKLFAPGTVGIQT